MKMAFLVIAFASFTGFVIGDPSSCGALLPTQEMDALRDQGSLFPDLNQLDAICPGFLSFSRCFRSALQDTPEDFDEDTLPIYQSLDDSFGDLCSEDSVLRGDYLSNVVCLKSVEHSWEDCLNASSEVYRHYKAANTEVTGAEGCFKRGLSVGCMSENIFKSCGQNAVSVYQLFMRKYRYMSNECDQSAAEALKTKLLNFLEPDDVQRSIYESAFDLALETS